MACSTVAHSQAIGAVAISRKAGSFAALGRVERLGDTEVLVDELPLKKWTHDYKQWLEQQLVGDDKAHLSGSGENQRVMTFEKTGAGKPLRRSISFD